MTFDITVSECQVGGFLVHDAVYVGGYQHAVGHTMAQLAKALPEGRGFDSLWCHCDFSLT
jgi:hypothetical protein